MVDYFQVWKCKINPRMVIIMAKKKKTVVFNLSDTLVNQELKQLKILERRWSHQHAKSCFFNLK